METADPEILIDAIQARPCLWDVFSMEYNDRYKTRTAWNEVAKTFHPEFDSFTEQEKNSVVLGVQRKWRNMRDSYVKDLRVWTNKSPSAIRSGKRRKYIFYDRLSFLKSSVEAKMARHPLPIKRERGTESDNSQSDEDSFGNTAIASEVYRIDPKALISVVEATPCIWDMSCPEYRDRAKTKESWLNICRVFYPQYDDLQEADRINILGTVQKMWRNFRDSFVKDWKASQNQSSRSLRRRKYIFYDILSFLLKDLENKKKTNPSGPLLEENSDELSYPEYENWFEGGDGGVLFEGEDEEALDPLETKYNPHLEQDAGLRREAEAQLEGGPEPQPIYPICNISNSPPGERREAGREIKEQEAREPDQELREPPPKRILKETPSATPSPVPEPSAHPAAPISEQPSTPASSAPSIPPPYSTPQPPVHPPTPAFAGRYQSPPAQDIFQDDDLAFFYSLLPAVRGLDQDDKLEFRVEAMRLLQKIKSKGRTAQTKQS